MPVETSFNRLVEEVVEAVVLLATGGDGSPHSLVITLARCACLGAVFSEAVFPEKGPSIDHAVTDLLLRMIVRRFHIRFKHKPKIILRHVVLSDTFTV